MTEAREDQEGRAELAAIRQEVRTLAAAHRALEQRLARAALTIQRTATLLAVLCLLLGFVLPAFHEKLVSFDDDDAPVSYRLVQLPFIAFGPSAPGETSNGRALDVVMGIGFTGLLVVAIGVIVALLASWEGLREWWPRWCARTLTLLLVIGTCVVLLLGAAGSASGGSIDWGTLVVLAVGSALAALLLLTDARVQRSGA